MDIIKTTPLLFTVENFLDIKECEEILNFNWNWEKSRGYDHATHSDLLTESRTSSTAQINYKDINLPERLRYLNKDISELLKIEQNRIEKPQLQKYEPMERYTPHWDYFFSGPNTDNNRTGTIIIYLNDNFKGGTTSFPKMHHVVRPQQGMLVYFEYTYTKEINDLTMHGGDVVIFGTKYIINTWIRLNKWP